MKENESLSQKRSEGLVFPEETQQILERLAAEDEIPVVDLISKLIGKEEEKRHIIWDRSIMAFARTKCNRKLCEETNVVVEKNKAY